MATITTFLELIDLVLGEAAYGAYTDWGAVADRNYSIIEAAIKDAGGSVTAGGTANALTLTANVGFTTYQNGRMIGFVAASTNTGAATLNVNGIGAKAIRMRGSFYGDVALVGGEITAGGVYHVVYNSALNSGAGAWELIDPTPAEGSFTPGISFGGASVGITYFGQSGRYSKIGRLYVAQVDVQMSNKGSSVGQARITGLPATPIAGAACMVYGSNFSGLTGALMGTMGGATTITLSQSHATGNTAVNDTFFTNTSSLLATAIFII